MSFIVRYIFLLPYLKITNKWCLINRSDQIKNNQFIHVFIHSAMCFACLFYLGLRREVKKPVTISAAKNDHSH